MLRPALALVPLSLAALILPAPSAQAAAATCHGLAATVEGSSGMVQGTSGNDVIIARGQATFVNAGPGDDVVCLVDTDNATVIADAGSDLVDTTQAQGQTYTQLGAGADTFVGGPGKDSVTYGGPDFHVTSPGDDTIATGAGNDLVSEVAGAAVDTGPGNDHVLLYLLAGQASTTTPFDLGPGSDELHVGALEALDANLTRGSLTVDGTTLPVLGVEDLVGYAVRISFTGSSKPNRVTVEGCHVELRGGGGNDNLELDRVTEDGPFDGCTPKARMEGQGGNDRLVGRDGADVLVGGPGRDVAWGQLGRDTCRAERTKHCER